MYPHAMIDIETLDTKPSAVVLSVGVVLFDRFSKEIGPEKLWCLDVKQQNKEGRTAGFDTIVFWMKQDSASASHFTGCYNSGDLFRTEDFKAELTGFLQGVDEFWAKSPNFDMVILENLLGKGPWKYSQLRDVRTAIALSGKEIKGLPTHNPIEDCKLQIKQLFESI